MKAVRYTGSPVPRRPEKSNESPLFSSVDYLRGTSEKETAKLQWYFGKFSNSSTT